MAEKETSLSSVNEVLPTELLKKILENLGIRSLCFAKQTCKHWNEIVDGFELVEKAISKCLEFFSLSILSMKEEKSHTLLYKIVNH